MVNRSDHAPELELQLVVVETTHEQDNTRPIDLITQYRILNKKCDEILNKIYSRRTTLKKN